MAQYPKIAVPAARSSLPLLTIRRRIVLIALLTAAALGLFASCAVFTSSRNPAPVTSTSASPAVALATKVARDYLDGVPTPVAVSGDVKPDLGFSSSGSRKTDPKTGESVNFSLPWETFNLAGVTVTHIGSVNPMEVDLVKFYVFMALPVSSSNSTGDSTSTPQASSAQFIYQLVVPMIVPDNGTPSLGALPTLLPYTQNNISGDAATYNNVKGSNSGDQINSDIKSSVERWAKDFASGGTKAPDLKLITKDDRPNTFYSGMDGWKAQVLSYGDYIPAPEGQTIPCAGSCSPQNAGGFIVRVTLVLTPPAGKGPDVQSEYDLWVNYTSGQTDPAILAWAPAGSYEQMQPLMNARVTG